MDYKILIADDQKINRLLIQKILSHNIANLSFYEADNGEEVLQILAREDIDLIILDLILPVLDGYQVLQAINRVPIYQDIPIIVNSAFKDISAIEKMLQQGVNDYFIKPLSPNDMNIILPLKARNALRLHNQSRTIIDLNKKIDLELKNAHLLAEIMLPKPQTLTAVELYYRYDPSLYVGGDCFDCLEKEGKTYFMIADVTGHGIAAGMASSMVKMLYRKTVEKSGIKPDQILAEMNKSIFEIFDFSAKSNFLMFTAFVGVIEDGNLSYANAGQPYPLMYRKKENRFFEIEEDGFAVGMLADLPYETKTSPFESGDAVFLYTDGLFSAGDSGDFCDWKVVTRVANQFILDFIEDPQQFLTEVYTAFEVRHISNNSNFNDDVALMLLTMK